MVVLSDADLERAANAAVYYSMLNTRPDVHLDRARLRRGADLRRVRRSRDREGPRAAPRHARPARRRSRSGSMTFAAAGRRRSSATSRTRAPAARASSSAAAARTGPATGSSRPCSSTSTTTMAIMREETFGPTLPIMKVADDDEAVRMANDSPYGLGASVFRTRRRARRGGRAADRGGRRVRQRRARQLLRARAADGRGEGVGDGLPPRRRAASASSRSTRRC